MGGGKKSNELWAIVPLEKFRDALDFLQAPNEPKVLFMPDIVRDGIIIVPPEKDISADLDPRSEKNRLRDYGVFIKGGGHAFIGAYAAAALRGKADANVALAAKVYEKDEPHLLKWYMEENPGKVGANPIDSSLVLREEGDGTSLNVVVEQAGATPIITGRQPTLRLSELPEGAHEAFMGRMRAADVVANLSVKSPSFRETVEAVIEGSLEVRELFSDCTSGDDMASNYRVLDVLKLSGKDGRSPITLLSINQHEARLYASLLKLEQDGKKEDVVRLFSAKKEYEVLKKRRKKDAELAAKAKEYDALMRGTGFRDGLRAARFLNRELGIPLLYHFDKGSCIVDSVRGRGTRIIPSVKLKELPDNFVGAGDTLCGGMALALAVKHRLDDPATGAPKELRLSMEDCLLIANLVTCYRLEQVARLSKEGSCEDWHLSVADADALTGWSGTAEFNSPKAPASRRVEIIAKDFANFDALAARGLFLSGLELNLAVDIYRIRRGMKAGEFALQDVEGRIDSEISRPGSWGAIPYLHGIPEMQIDAEDCRQVAHRLIGRHAIRVGSGHEERKRMLGKALALFGEPALGTLLDYMKRTPCTPELKGMHVHPWDLETLAPAAQAAGRPFLSLLEKELMDHQLMVMLCPWKNELLYNLLDTAGMLGDECTAKVLSRMVPTVRLWVQPPQEAPSLRAIGAIGEITARAGLADADVAQVLHCAQAAGSAIDGLGFMVGIKMVLEDYDPDRFHNVARECRDAIAENISANGGTFFPEDPPYATLHGGSDGDELGFWAQKKLHEAFKANSVDSIPERDHRELMEKVAILRRLQANLFRSNEAFMKSMEQKVEQRGPAARRK